MNERLETISKEASFALRHCPEEFSLTLDENGFASRDKLISGINARNPGINVTAADIEELVQFSEKNATNCEATKSGHFTDTP